MLQVRRFGVLGKLVIREHQDESAKIKIFWGWHTSRNYRTPKCTPLLRGDIYFVVLHCNDTRFVFDMTLTLSTFSREALAMWAICSANHNASEKKWNGICSRWSLEGDLFEAEVRSACRFQCTRLPHFHGAPGLPRVAGIIFPTFYCPLVVNVMLANVFLAGDGGDKGSPYPR